MDRRRGLQRMELERLLSRFRGMQQPRQPRATNIRDAEMSLRQQRLGQNRGTRGISAAPAAGGIGNANLRRLVGHPAVGFSQSLAGGNTAQPAIDAISKSVYDSLSSRGIYKDDTGNWNVKGLERPIDVGRMIRDTAISAMDKSGGRWSELVGQADRNVAGYSPPPGISSTSSRPSTPAVTRSTTSQRTAPTVSPGGRSTRVPSPGLGGVPQPRPTTPVPQPGLGGVPASPQTGFASPEAIREMEARARIPAAPRQAASPQELASWQRLVAAGVPGGGYSHPDSAAAQEARARGQAQQPGLGGVPQRQIPTIASPRIGGPNVVPHPGLGGVPSKPLPTIPSPRIGGPNVVPQPGLGGVPARQLPVIPSPRRAGTVGPNGLIYNTPGQTVPQPGLGGVPIRPQQTPGMGVPQPGLGGVTPAAPVNRPPAGFGTSGATAVPRHPGAIPPGDLSSLGSRIASHVQGRIANPQQPQMLPTTGSNFVDTLRNAVTTGIQNPNISTGMGPAGQPTGGPRQGPARVSPGATTTGSYGTGWPGQQMDQLNGAYDSASAQTGVPGNVIKAVQTLETGGDVFGKTGTQNCEIRPESGCIALNSGIYQSTAEAYGLDYNRIVSDPEYAAYAVGVVLQNIADDPASQWGGGGGTVLESYGWDGVVNVYFGGNVGGGFTDELGTGSGEYLGHYQNYLSMLGGVGSPANPTSTTQMGGTTSPNGVYMHPETLAGLPGKLSGSQPVTNAGSPQGIIDPSGLSLGNATGVDWATINQWDATVQQEAARWGVDPAIIKAAIAMESGGVAYPNQANAPASSGLLQIERQWHDASAAQLGYDLGTPEGQIGYFAALISGNAPGQSFSATDPLGRYIESYQGPQVQPDQSYAAAYRSDVEYLMGLQSGVSPQGQQGTTYTGPPIDLGPPADPTGARGLWDPYFVELAKQSKVTLLPDGTVAPVTAGGDNDSAIPGGNGDPRQAVIAPGPSGLDDLAAGTAPNGQAIGVWTPETTSFLDALTVDGSAAAYENNYHFGSQGPALYCKYENWDCNTHSGIDIPTKQFQGSDQFNSLTEGQVICVGYESSAANPGVGCGDYDAPDSGGIGNISVLAPNGAVVVYGHSQTSAVKLGGTVGMGQPLGMSGSYNGYHVHLDVKLPIGPGGKYVLVDPVIYFNGGYCEIGFCPY